MAKGRKNGRRWLGLGAVLTALAALLAAGAPAEAMPASPQEWAVQTLAGAWAPEADPPPERRAEPVRAVMPESPVPEEPADPTAPETEPVEDGYFADAAFLGDSRTEGFSLYSGLKEGTYFFAVGATVESVFTKQTRETAAGKVPLLDAMGTEAFGKVYIMLGVNELGWPRAEQFKEQYGELVDRVREDHPGAKVVLQSILPVSAKQEAKGSYVNNGRIAVFNGMVKELAEEKECPYLDVAAAVAGEDGCLRADLTFDGVHLNTAGCRIWLDYLRTHAV